MKGFWPRVATLKSLQLLSVVCQSTKADWGSASRAAVLDEKAAAAQALGIYAAEAREAFAPHIEDALATLVAMANYFHDDVRHANDASTLPPAQLCLLPLHC